jgi:type II secretory pathway predicted ATPase ExeA
VYKEFFGLKDKAFAKTPDPRFLFLNDEFEEAISQFLFAVEEKELGVLTGEIGSGKTLISRALIDRIENHSEIALITNPRLTPTQLLKTIAVEFGIEKPKHLKSDLSRQIEDRLLELYENETDAVLIIDEAHLIPRKDSFDELRLLTNFQLDDTNLISILLIGQPELLRRLKHKSYRALTQRIGAEFHLARLPQSEVDKYVRHRLSVAGSNGANIFGAEAVERLAYYSGGIPRVINNIATQCMLEAMAHDSQKVTGAMVESVVSGMKFLEIPEAARG